MLTAQPQGHMARDIAIGVVITALLIAVTLRSPILGFFCTFLIPLPTLYYRLKLGRSMGIVIPIMALGIIIALSGRISLDLVFFLELLGIGFILGELLNRPISIEKTVLTVCAAVWGSGLLALFFYSSFSSMGVGELLSAYVRENLEATMALYEGMGMSDENIQVIKDAFDRIQYVLVRLIPALTACSTLAVIWICLLLARPLLTMKGLAFTDFGPLNRWKAPEVLVWGAIAAGMMLLLPSPTVKLIGINAIMVLMTIYFFQGIAIVSYFFEHRRVPRFFRFFLYSLIVLQQIFLFIVVGIGFFDVWMNFRKRLGQKSG